MIWYSLSYSSIKKKKNYPRIVMSFNALEKQGVTLFLGTKLCSRLLRANNPLP